MAIYNTIIRNVLIRGNFFAGDGSALESAYDTTHFSQASITRGDGEYTFNAIVDAILLAHEMLVASIGENRESEYRAWFTEASGNITHGSTIPLVGTGAKTRYGVISNVKDSSQNIYLTHQPREMVEMARANHSRSITDKYYFFTDDVRIWHTRTNVIADIVTWSKTADRTAILANNNTAACAMPDALIPDLLNGSLAFIFRDIFRMEQALQHWQLFAASLNNIAGKQMASMELPAKV